MRYHTNQLSVEPKKSGDIHYSTGGQNYLFWREIPYFPAIAGDVALFNEAILGGFKFSRIRWEWWFNSSSADQKFETSDGNESTLQQLQ